jgi:glycine cleavage system H protein
LDYALNRKKAPAASRLYVEGFAVAEGVRYHPGHTWLARERQHLARVGVDEFAAKLAGKIQKIELPKAGQWIRQGQTAWTLYRNGESTSMVSPIEGEVVEVNPDVVNDPSLLGNDPYGKGWLMTVHVPDEEGTWRNLLPVNMVRSWMKDAVTRLYARQPAFAGAVAADGGRPVDDLLAGIPGAEWRRITAEFFLT